MANRRFGGNQRGGGRSFQQANLNPWQGGVTPGNSLDNNIQTQLALAITNLLQPQQQNNPPSLLSLNTSPGFMNQDNNYNLQSRFGSRGRSDVRRSEPYSKTRGGSWRNDRRGFSSTRSNSRSFKDKKSDNEKFRNSDSAKPSKSVDDSKSKNADIIDISMEEPREPEGNEDQEAKREWLKEKNNEDAAEESEEKPDENEEQPAEGERKFKKDTTKFAGLPSGYLHCFVCDKSMWDGESFQNHIRGKAHKQMITSLEDSFQVIVNILRENMRLAEEKKMIELNRIQRNNRKFMHKYQEPESHCNMCDLKFLGKIISHRKTEGHQRLKRFLHPNCDTCNLEFPSRMEWVDHCFTPEHLHKLHEVLQEKNTPEDGYKIFNDKVEFEIEPLLEESMQTEDDNPVLELTDDLQNLQNRIPAYIKSRPISTASLSPAQGSICELCNRFFACETTAQEHLKSELHYHNFITEVKNKYKRMASEKAEGDEENAKRAKVDAEEDDENKEQEKEDEVPKNEGDAAYDPEEACKEEENEDAKADVGAEIKTENADESWSEQKGPAENAENDVKIEIKDESETVQPDAAAKSPRRRGPIRNGAGPRGRGRGKK